MPRKIVLVACLGAAILAPTAHACDVCSVYAFFDTREPASGFYASLFEQYTDFATLRLDGVEVDNPEGEFLHSSITQVAAGYQATPRLGVQVNVPYAHRSYRRAGEEGVETGSESGIGDVTVLAHFRAVERAWGESSLIWTVLGGVELPTGDTDRLLEEVNEGDGEEEHASGVHGHDLALGSGSVDGLVGTSVYASRNRFDLEASAQYALRTVGDFDYRFGNDLTWRLAAGWFAVLEHDRALRLGVELSGEKKEQDRLGGRSLEDTAITALYAGPLLSYSRTGRYHLDLRYDLPVDQDNSALQIVPDRRIRLAATVRF